MIQERPNTGDIPYSIANITSDKQYKIRLHLAMFLSWNFSYAKMFGRNWDSSVGKVTTDSTSETSVFGFLVETRDYSVYQCFQSDFGAHPTCCPIGMGDLFTKLNGRDVKLSTLLLLVTATLKMRGTVPCVLPWRALRHLPTLLYMARGMLLPVFNFPIKRTSGA